MKLTTKQKVLIPIIILAFIYIIWQVYDMFFAGSDMSTPAPTPVVQPAPATATPAAMPTGVSAPAPQITPPQRKTAADLKIGDSKGEQTAFSNLMKQYQSLQAKRMLLQEQVAIAQTRHKIAELNAKLGNLGISTTNGANDKTPAHVSGYSLSYLDQQHGRWTAILSRNGNQHEVVAGTRLPGGVKVVSINSRGVTIHANEDWVRLTFSGPVKLKYQPFSAISSKKDQSVTKTKKVITTQVKSIKAVLPKITVENVGTPSKKPNYKIEPTSLVGLANGKSTAKQPLAKIKPTAKKPTITVNVTNPSSKSAAPQKPLKIQLSPNPIKSGTKVEKKKPLAKTTYTVSKKKALKLRSNYTVQPVTVTNTKSVNKPRLKTSYQLKTIKQKAEKYQPSYMLESTKQPTYQHPRVIHLKPAKQQNQAVSSKKPTYRVRKLQPRIILESSKKSSEQPIRLSPYRSRDLNSGLANDDALT